MKMKNTFIKFLIVLQPAYTAPFGPLNPNEASLKNSPKFKEKLREESNKSPAVDNSHADVPIKILFIPIAIQFPMPTVLSSHTKD